MHELYQIRLMLSQLSAIGGQHQAHYQPLGPYQQQYYPPAPSDYMGMVPQQPPTTTEPPPIVSSAVPEKPIPDSTNQTESLEVVSTTPIVEPIELGTTQKSNVLSSTTSRSISFKPVQTKSLKSSKPVARKK